MTTKQDILKSIPQKGFFGHPKGLLTLFFTEFWERFSYYGMRAILVYYMYDTVANGGLGIDEKTALSVVSIYGSLVYMSGIIGGWIADRLLGTTKTVFYGGILIMLGHIALAMPGGVTAFFVSMALIVIGTGLLKPNISTVVGQLYDEKDARRDGGFSIFYMGINMGAFLSPLVIGAVQENYNYHLGFGVAAVGMFLGLVVFAITKKKFLGLAGTGVAHPLSAEDRKKLYVRATAGIAAILVIGYVLISQGIMTIDVFITMVSFLGIVIPTLYFIMMYRSPKTNADEKSRVLAYIPLFIAATMFWAIAEQSATVLALYADTRVNLSILGYEISPAWFQSLNPLFIIGLAPVFAWMWVKLGVRQPSTPKKFAYSLFFSGLSFLIMIYPALSGADTLVSPWWLIASFFLVVIGELLMSPVGLSATTKLAPTAFAAQTMSLWFLTSAAAQAINAQLVKLYSADNEIMYFGVLGGLSLVIGFILLVLAPKFEKMMRGVR